MSNQIVTTFIHYCSLGKHQLSDEEYSIELEHCSALDYAERKKKQARTAYHTSMQDPSYNADDVEKALLEYEDSVKKYVLTSIGIEETRRGHHRLMEIAAQDKMEISEIIPSIQHESERHVTRVHLDDVPKSKCLESVIYYILITTHDNSFSN